MDAVSNPDIPEMVLMKCARVGFTEGVIGNGIGYYIDQDPAPILVVQPSDEDAEDWSKRKLAPMLRDTPRLANRVADARSRDSDNTIKSKTFPGGSLKITGATSPKGLRRTDTRIAFLDEVDGYPPSAGAEGDPVSLARRRLTTFWNRKLILGSTPTLKGISRIEKALDESDQRSYHVPCPHCGRFQVLRWGGPNESYGIKWEDEKPQTAAYLCESCGALIEEAEKPAMVAQGRWVAKHPERSIPGWHLTALVSLFDGARWPVLVDEWLTAKDDPERLKVFVNTVLGETWEIRGEGVSPESLAARAEQYPEEVPAGAGLLTSGVDVQADRLEVEIDGWGMEEENWMVAHHRLYGDPSQEEVWQRLESILTRPYKHELGATIRIRACVIDSGFRTGEVYRFVRPRQHRNVWASKGLDERGKAPLSRATRANRDGVKLFTIGTVAMKDTLFSRLRIQRPGPRYMHFCAQTDDGADAEYFAQLGAEKAVIEKVRGRPIRRYVQVRTRNEAIDLKVLNLAALAALFPMKNREHQLRREVEQIKKAGKKRREEPPPDEQGATPPPAPKRPSPRRGWVNRWRPR